MRAVEYKRYMASEQWRVVKQERLARDGYKCQRCGDNRGKLDVHHKTYDRLGHEMMDDLESLCTRCHWESHRVVRFSDRLVKRLRYITYERYMIRKAELGDARAEIWMKEWVHRNRRRIG